MDTHKLGYRLSIFSLHGDHVSHYEAPSEPVEENAETIKRHLRADLKVQAGNYIATIERFGMGGIHSQMVRVSAKVVENHVEVSGAAWQNRPHEGRDGVGGGFAGVPPFHVEMNP